MVKKSLVCWIIILFLASTATTFNITNASNTTEIKAINPFTGDENFVFYSNMTPIGTRFNATVWVYDVTSLFAHQVKLAVDDSLLNITNAWIPRTDPSYVFYGLPTMPVGPTFYDTESDGKYESVLVGDTILGTGSFNGTGLLAIVEMEIIYAPETGEETSDLNINNVDTFLLDSSLSDIPSIKIDGLYRIMGAPAPPIPSANLYLNPSTISDPSLTPGKSLAINVEIANATDIYALKLKLSYDPTIIIINNVSSGGFLPEESYLITIDNIAGILDVSSQLTPPETPKSGSGILLAVYFDVTGIGATPLDLFDIELKDQEGELLDYTSEDGFFSNVFKAKLSVYPEEIISPELLPPHIFSVNITVDDVENLYSYEFNLTYNTQMLTCIGTYIFSLQNQSYFTTSMQMNDMEGWIWVNVTFYEPAVPVTTYTPKPIVKLTFIVENAGSSILHLDSSKLIDQAGEPILHETTDGYVQTLIRDVAIINVVAEPDWVYQGWIVNITVTAKNMGNTSETFNVKIFYNDNLLTTETITNLSPEEEKIIHFSWNTSGVSEGIYTIKAEATQVPYEFNTENNIFVDGNVEVRTLIQDIALIEMTSNPTAVYPGWIINITVTVRNEGNLSETFILNIYYNMNVITSIQVDQLAPNDERIIIYTWNTTGLPECSNYTLSAEAEPLPYEVDVEDNYIVDGVVKIKIYGDINGDDKVDIRDVAVVASAFGSYPGHPRWNPDADLNLDGRVDIRDVAIVASNFGRVC